MEYFSYETLDDAKRHAAAIERLAALAHVKKEDVQPLYEKILAEMLEQARIKTFLPIFTARRVEKLLPRMRATNLGLDGGNLPAISTV